MTTIATRKRSIEARLGCSTEFRRQNTDTGSPVELHSATLHEPDDEQPFGHVAGSPSTLLGHGRDHAEALADAETTLDARKVPQVGLGWRLTLSSGAVTRHESREAAEQALRAVHPGAQRMPGGEYRDASGLLFATISGRTRRGSTLRSGATGPRLDVSYTAAERSAWERAAGDLPLATWLRRLANAAVGHASGG